MKRDHHVMFSFVATMLVSMGGLRAHAQETCIPTGGAGVPGQPGLPDWWASAAPFDDPRWLGAYGYGQNTIKLTSMVEESGGQRFLLLKWHVKPDAGAAGAGDHVLVGFFNPATEVGTVFNITRDAAVTTVAGSVGPGVMSITALGRTGVSGGWGGVSVPAGVTADARIDTFCDTALPPTCDEWAIRLRVPTTAAAGGLDLPDVFRLWFQADVDHGPTLDRARFPVGAIVADENALPPILPEPLGSAAPASAPWNLVRIGGAGTCVAGVEFVTHSDINVSNAGGTGNSIAVTGANTFHARPRNSTGTAFDPNAIKARFRIADWGSAVGDSPLWLTVPGVGCDVATGTGPAGSITGGTPFDLTCSWTLTPGQACAYRPDLDPGCTPDPAPRYQHQCIMAELSSNGPVVPFARESYWNNFEFVSASKVERKARIDIGARGPRDAYVYVMTNHMPSKLDSDPPAERSDAPRLADDVRKRLGKIVPGRVGHKESEALQGLVAAGAITYDDLAEVMPTYAAYVWHDTGASEASPAGTVKLLEAQPSFTLFVSHDGPLVGWNHGLAGVAGVTVTELSKDFYRIAVGASGTVEVMTTIEAVEANEPAVEPKPPVEPQNTTPPGTPWWAWLLVLLVGVLVIVFLLRNRP